MVNVLDEKTECSLLDELEDGVVYTLRYVWHAADGTVQCSVQSAVAALHREYVKRFCNDDDISAAFVEYVGEYSPRFFFRVEKLKSEEKKNETVCS